MAANVCDKPHKGCGALNLKFKESFKRSTLHNYSKTLPLGRLNCFVGHWTLLSFSFFKLHLQ